MLDQLLGNPCHIRWFPREYFSVSPKEANEHAFLFVTLAASDQSCLGWVTFLQLDGLDADIAGVGFNPRLAIPQARDIHLRVGEFLHGREYYCRGLWHADVVAYSIASWSQSYDFFRSPRSVSTLVLPGSLSSR
jgi:hypothetical protein